jgi:ankyrin repeat protein
VQAVINEHPHTIDGEEDGWTALREVVNIEKNVSNAAAEEERRLPVLKALLDAGANQKIHSKKGQYPIHAAAEDGRLKLVQVLCEHPKAPSDIIFITTPSGIATGTGTGGNTPLHYAGATGKTNVWDYLVGKGANPSWPKNENGNTPQAKLDHFARTARTGPTGPPMQKKSVNSDRW